jgi:hypothetical protein
MGLLYSVQTVQNLLIWRNRCEPGFGDTLYMNLSELGMDAWIAPSISELSAQDLSAARVTAVDRGRYLVRNEAGEVPAELTG